MFGKKHQSTRKSSSPIDSGDSPTLPQEARRQASTVKRSPTLSSPRSPPAAKMSFPHSSDQRAGVPPRQYLTRVPSVQTRYMEMLLHLDRIPRLHNILASIFTWVLLAGFLVIPGTFTSFKNSAAFKDADENDSNQVANAIVHGIKNVGLLWVSGAFCVIGALGCLWLWFMWRKNYVWLLNRIFLPALLNSIAGLLTTIVNVYTAQKGVWSITAKITAIVTGSCAGVAGALFAAYNFWVLGKVRKTHEREVDPEEYDRRKNKKNRESMVEKVKRKAQEPALEPGSVV